MDIQFDGSLTKKDFMAFFRLGNSSILGNNSLRMDPWLWWFIAGTFFLIAGIIGFWATHSIPGIFLLGLLDVVIFWNAARSYPLIVWNANPMLRVRVQGKVSDDGIEYQGSTSTLHLDWEGLYGYGEYQDVVGLVHEKPRSMTPFPKSYFKTDADWLAFKEMVGQHLTVTHEVTTPKLSLVWRLLIVSTPICVALYFIIRDALSARNGP